MQIGRSFPSEQSVPAAVNAIQSRCAEPPSNSGGSVPMVAAPPGWWQLAHPWTATMGARSARYVRGGTVARGSHAAVAGLHHADAPHAAEDVHP